MSERDTSRWALAGAVVGAVLTWAGKAFDPAGPGGSSLTDEELFELGTKLFNTVLGSNLDPKEVQERLGELL